MQDIQQEKLMRQAIADGMKASVYAELLMSAMNSSQLKIKHKLKQQTNSWHELYKKELRPFYLMMQDGNPQYYDMIQSVIRELCELVSDMNPEEILHVCYLAKGYKEGHINIKTEEENEQDSGSEVGSEKPDA